VGETDDDPDAAAVAAWRAGDKAAGEKLFEKHFDALYRFFRNKAEEGVEDLIQQTFLAVVGSIERFRGEASFRSYLFAIARNELLAHWRKRGQRSADVDVAEISIAAMSSAQPSRVVARRREQQMLLEALRTLPLDLQIALELVYWEDLTGPELAAALGVPEGTARSRLRRGKEMLAARLAELAGDPATVEESMRELDLRITALG
jgi:RNA polymerase sigma-70 factor (ECF subfamily)